MHGEGCLQPSSAGLEPPSRPRVDDDEDPSTSERSDKEIEEDNEGEILESGDEDLVGLQPLQVVSRLREEVGHFMKTNRIRII